MTCRNAWPSCLRPRWPSRAPAGATRVCPEDVARLGYVNRHDRFAMDVPPGWQVREMTGPQPVIVSKPGDPPGAARPCVTVEVIPDWGTVPLEMLARSSLAGLDAVPGFRLIGQGPMTTATGQPAWSVTFVLAPTGEPVTERQMLLVAGGKSYAMTAAAASDAFAAEEPNFEVCFRSLRAGW